MQQQRVLVHAHACPVVVPQFQLLARTRAGASRRASTLARGRQRASTLARAWCAVHCIDICNRSVMAFVRARARARAWRHCSVSCVAGCVRVRACHDTHLRCCVRSWRHCSVSTAAQRSDAARAMTCCSGVPRARTLGVIAQFEIECAYARPRMLQRAAAAAVLHVRAGRHCSVSSMHACPHGRGWGWKCCQLDGQREGVR